MDIETAIVEGVTGVTKDWTAKKRLEAVANEIRQYLKQTAQNVFLIGQKLIEARGLLPHGKFEAWAEAETGLTIRTAQRFMSVARRFEGKGDIMSLLPPTVIYQLASPSTPDSAIDEVLEIIGSGEDVSVALTNGIVADHQLAARTIIETSSTETIQPSHIKSVVAVLREIRDTGALDVGEGEMLPISEALKAAITEETYERMMRQSTHIRDKSLTAANSGTGPEGDEWYTPVDYIEAARQLMGGIDLDPASCDAAQETVQALAYFTREDDGLTKDWHGRVWLNPPYSYPLVEKFVHRLIAQYEYENISTALTITNNCTDAAWFHCLLERFPVCFTKGRVPFWRPNQESFATRQGQAIFYLGNEINRFAEIFSKFGIVVTRL